MDSETFIQLMTLLFGFATTMATLLIGYKQREQDKKIDEIKAQVSDKKTDT